MHTIGNASLDEAGDVEEVLEEAGDTEGDKTTTPEPTQVVTQNTDEGLHYGKANKQVKYLYTIMTCVHTIKECLVKM